MENISIDAHIPKLLDWLISRRICNKDWQLQIVEVREKINEAIQDMPEHKEIAELLSGTYINYFYCCRIVEILKETEADTKNLFGRYGSQRMKDWQEIISLYKKNNVYLAEAVYLLLQNVKYEVPNLKKQLAKAKQNQLDCEKKCSNYEKSVVIAKRELDAMCKQLGISEHNIRMELLERISHLDDVYKKIMSHIKTLKEPSKYYSTFSHYVTKATFTLNVINYLIEHGNTTVYEYLHGEVPQQIELPKYKFFEEIETDQRNEEIDWDVPMENIAQISEEKDGINWGISEIDDSSYEITTLEESGIVVEKEMSSIAKGNEAYTVLDSPKTRGEFITQLLELESFLEMRLLEIQNSDGMPILNDFNEVSEDVEKMLSNVREIKRLIKDQTVEQLHFIKHSRKYIDKVIAQFDQKVSNIEKMLASAEAVKLRSKEAEQNESNLRPKLKLVIQKTKRLQRDIEQDISNRYNNRQVNLMGGF